MQTMLVELSKYAILCSFLLFTITGFATIGKSGGRMFSLQRFYLFFIHFLGFLTLFIQTKKVEYMAFYAAQLLFFVIIIVLYHILYPKMSKLIINNMCMLLAVGMLMISRITFTKAVKQFVIVVASCVIGLFVPVFIKKVKWLSKPVWLYAAFGIGFLGAMKMAGIITYGASITFTVAGITIQPVEFVKIIFVFFLASFLSRRQSFRDIMIVSALAAVHVLLLVWSKELGGALIFCVVYLALVYVATRQPLYFAGGLLVGSGAAVVAYHLFNHVRVRVLTWSTPFSVIKNDTSQISQSLFAIGTGGWFGMGLMEGIPDTIPVSSEDMIFSAITEELGLFFSLCLLLICLSTFILFINIATRIREPFYKLLATGLGIEYIFQVFLTVGGGTKFIPLTGVTLPLVSYGGSSVLCSIIMFQIIQGIYVLKPTEDWQEPEEVDYGEDYDEEYDTEYDSDYEEEYEDDYDSDYEEEYEDDYEEDDYKEARRRRNQQQYAKYEHKEQDSTFDEYAVSREMELDIPGEYFED